MMTVMSSSSNLSSDDEERHWEKIQHLKLIFGGADLDDETLSSILQRHHGNVEESVNWILDSQQQQLDRQQILQQQQSDDDESQRQRQRQLDDTDRQRRISDNFIDVNFAYAHDTSNNFNTPTVVALPPSPASSASISAGPSPASWPTPPLGSHFAVRPGRDDQSTNQPRQLQASQNEEEQLAAALQSSLHLSHRGLDYLSDEDLDRLLLQDPIFVASLENDRIGYGSSHDDDAILLTLQTKLEAAEEEWKQKELERNKNKSTSGLLIKDSISKLTQQHKQQILDRIQHRKEQLLENKQVLLERKDKVLIQARSNLGISTAQEQILISQLERMNKENEEEQERRQMRLEAKEQMLETVRDHLKQFIQDHPHCTYEQWIMDLHPENSQNNKDNVDLLGLGSDVTAQISEQKSIDRRFYVPESEHLQLWNETCRSSTATTSIERKAVLSTAESATAAADDLLSAPMLPQPSSIVSHDSFGIHQDGTASLLNTNPSAATSQPAAVTDLLEIGNAEAPVASSVGGSSVMESMTLPMHEERSLRATLPTSNDASTNAGEAQQNDDKKDDPFSFVVVAP